ncbi:MAG: class I SAM-dependent methyltransferase [Phycisphaerae bacterium]
MSPAKISGLYQDGRIYDRLYADSGADVPFYLALAGECSDPILELACGTGKYLIPWAQAGHLITGVDIAPAMLERAAEKARQMGVRVSLHAADMRRFDLAARFGLVVIAGNSLCHLHTDDDLRLMLECVRRHLAAGGQFVIDVFIPDARLLARDADLRFPFGEYEDPADLSRVYVTYAQRYDAVAQLSYVTLFAARQGGASETRHELTLRMWYPCELEAAVRSAGFRIVERFGGHNRAPLDSRAGKQILVLDVPAEMPP